MRWLAGQAFKAGVGDSVEGALGVLEGEGVECSYYCYGLHRYFYVPVPGVPGGKKRVRGASGVLGMLNAGEDAHWQRLRSTP